MRQLYISWSQLKYWEECRHKAYLLRSGKKPKDNNIRGYFPGTVVDRVMKEYLSLPDDTHAKGYMASSLTRILDREEISARETGDGIVKWKGPTNGKSDRAQVLDLCKELVTRLEPILDEHVLLYGYDPSRRFKVPLTVPYITPDPDTGESVPVTVYIVGEMDILVREDRDEARPWAVWDLKATKNNSYWRSTIGQLVFYDLACYMMFGQYTRVSGLIQPMCNQEVVGIEITDQQRIEMMQRILAMCHSIWRDDLIAESGGMGAYPVAPSTRPCYMCQVKKVCVRYAGVAGPDGKSKMTFGNVGIDLNSLEIDNAGIDPEGITDIPEDAIDKAGEDDSFFEGLLA